MELFVFGCNLFICTIYFCRLFKYTYGLKVSMDDATRLFQEYEVLGGGV